MWMNANVNIWTRIWKWMRKEVEFKWTQIVNLNEYKWMWMTVTKCQWM